MIWKLSESDSLKFKKKKRIFSWNSIIHFSKKVALWSLYLWFHSMKFIHTDSKTFKMIFKKVYVWHTMYDMVSHHWWHFVSICAHILIIMMSNIASNDIVLYKTDLHDIIMLLFDIVKIYAFSRSSIYTSNEFIDQFKKNL